MTELEAEVVTVATEDVTVATEDNLDKDSEVTKTEVNKGTPPEDPPGKSVPVISATKKNVI